MKKLNVLSLFDGLGGGRIALSRLGIECNYYASEIDKAAIEIHKKNFPDTIHLGDVRNVKASDLPEIDLLIGGSPCQGFSFAGEQLAFSDPRSALFFEFVRIKNELKEVNPDLLFMLENVKMKKQFEDVISLYTGVQPIFINSSLVSAQSRKRLYWTNITGVTMPEDKGIRLIDVLEYGEPFRYDKRGGGLKIGAEKSQCIDANYFKGIDSHGQRTGVIWKKLDTSIRSNRLAGWSENGSLRAHRNDKKKSTLSEHIYSNPEGKSVCVTTSQVPKIYRSIDGDYYVRKLTPLECERLQTLPDHYTAGVADGQRYKMIGNGWTIDVIAHIFNAIPEIARIAKAA